MLFGHFLRRGPAAAERPSAAAALGLNIIPELLNIRIDILGSVFATEHSVCLHVYP